MLKGVNKTIIEINNTENEYFDRILLFVNPRYADDGRVDREVQKIQDRLKNENNPLPLRFICRKAKLRRVLIASALGLAVATVVAVFFIMK